MHPSTKCRRRTVFPFKVVHAADKACYYRSTRAHLKKQKIVERRWMGKNYGKHPHLIVIHAPTWGTQYTASLTRLLGVNRPTKFRARKMLKIRWFSIFTSTKSYVHVPVPPVRPKITPSFCGFFYRIESRTLSTLNRAVTWTLVNCR